MTRAPFAIRSFWGILIADRAICFTVVEALAVSAQLGREAGVAWILGDDRSVGGGWSEFAIAAFRALSTGGREATNDN
jgi:hypothetical protein